MSTTFPPQQTLSIKETISTDLPEFIPHYEVIYMGISDLFRNKLASLTPSDQSYLDSLSSSSDNDKAIASEIALWHNQSEYAAQCVGDVDNNALCHRMQLMLTRKGEDRKQIKGDDAKSYEINDEYKFTLLDYNLQTFSGATSDSNAIDVLLKTELNNMNNLISNGNCNWRFHLLYAQLLCRVSLDSNAVQQQIDLAQGKLGSDANSHYAFQALIGDLYVRMRQFDKARDALTKACSIMSNDGYCRSRLIYTYLYENNYNSAIDIWNKCVSDLSSNGGIETELLNCFSNYINMSANLDDFKNNDSITNWNGNETYTYIGTSLKLFILAYKSGQYVGDNKFGIVETSEFTSTLAWTDKQNDLAQTASHLQRMVASFIKFFVDMFTNDDIESWDMQGPVLDNVFSSFERPLFDDILDALSFENYLLGMFKLRWKGDCKNAFRFSIICNCRLNMNSYIGEVIGFQNAGSSDIAVEKIKEIQKFVNVSALELMPIDAKRMNIEDDFKNCIDAQQDLINLISKNPSNYDAILALSDIYISFGKWQSALLLMQQVIEFDCKSCNKNLELRMKWATTLYFNGYLPLANQIFKEYATKDFEASSHEYYCGLAANCFYELGKFKDLDKMDMAEKFKGQNMWMYKYLCYKYWVEFFIKKKKNKKKKKKQPVSGGKSQYDKAIDMSKKMIRLDENYPLGYALLARSNIELIESVDNMQDKIRESVDKAVALADELLSSKSILPQIYYETMIHCGIAIYQIDEDGSKYYNKAVDNAPHGETILLKLQREKITSKLDTQATRELLIEIQKNNLNMNGYKKALPLFQYDFQTAINLANEWDIFTPKSDLPESGQLGMNITKPDANPNGGDGGGGGAKKPKKKNNIPPPPSMVPDTDDSKGDIPPPPPAQQDDIKIESSGGGGGSGDGIQLESVFKYVNLCSNSWPSGRLTYSLPFDDATQLGEGLIILLRKLMSDIGIGPKDENDLIGRLHWGGENALQDVLDACEGKTDAQHLGLSNFAYTYKVDMGLGSDEHLQCIDAMMNVTKNLTYEGKIGFASLKGLQCISFEADVLFKEVSQMKDSDGSDWLYWRHFGQYLLLIKQDYIGACNALEKAYKINTTKDPMTIGWYCIALSKVGNKTQIISQIFDEIGKYHDSNTDIAVIREEFLNNFDIKTPAIYDSLCKSGITPFMQARKLICRAKYDRQSIGNNIIELCKNIKPSSSNDKMFRIIVNFFTTQAQWIYNNSLRQCIDGMTKAGTSCMDWTLGAAFTSFCFAKKGDWDSAMGGIDCLPTKTFDPIIFQCAAMLTNGLAEDIEMNKKLSPFMFISRINNLRFGQKKDTDNALKELISEYLSIFKQDFNGLVALADIWLSMGAFQTAYKVYYTIYKLYPVKYKQNFTLRLKFAECMRINGFQSEALCEFRNTYNSFHDDDKGFGEEINEISDLIIGYAFLCLTIGDYEQAEILLKQTNKRHILNKLAKSHLILLRHGTDSEKCKSVYNDCKDIAGDNPLLLALAIRAGKVSGDDISELETKLKELIGGKYKNINAIREYCELSIGLSSDASNECLTNNILIKCINEGVGQNVYDGLKDLYSKNKYPSQNDIFSVIGSLGVQNINDDISCNINALQPVPADNITDDYQNLNTEAIKEIEAIKSGKISSGGGGGGGNKSSSKGKGGKSSKKRKSESLAPSSAGVKAGPKPKIDYASTSLSERKKWSFKMCDNLPTPNSSQVKNWSVNQVGDFISKIPIFGLNEWYGKKFKESNVNGKMFLESNEQKLIKWGIDRKCHRARFRAEALAMKRRG